MRIVSKFKDYYDFVGQRYGEDPEVRFMRGKVKALKEDVHCTVFGHENLKTDTATRTDYSVVVVVAGDMLFPMARMEARASDTFGNPVIRVSFRHLDKATLHWTISNDARLKSKYYNPDDDWAAMQDWLDGVRKQVPAMMRECGSPVFLLHRVSQYRMNVAERVPYLGAMDIPALVPPEAMWQNVYSAITTHMRANPDKAPPVEISNQDKIVKAGFDLKTSFRDPVNQKPKKRRK